MTVTYAPYSSACVADYAVMLMLMSIRRMRQIIRRNGINDITLPGIQGKEMRNMTVGVLGTGRDRPRGDSRPERLRL